MPNFSKNIKVGEYYAYNWCVKDGVVKHIFHFCKVDEFDIHHTCQNMCVHRDGVAKWENNWFDGGEGPLELAFVVTLPVDASPCPCITSLCVKCNLPKLRYKKEEYCPVCD